MTLTVLGISGSLRKGSFNSAALRAAVELAPEGLAVEPLGIGDIPLYNEDVRSQGLPAPVQSLRDALKRADGVLIVTPEYNYSVPGVLKNAIDWASRPPEQPFDRKPLAIMSASTGQLGGARAQYHLRQVFVALNARVLNRPEIMIAQAAGKFDESGRLADEPTREFIRKLLGALKSVIEERR
ncbi:NADPH-dependent FMN reductase [Alsobacter soli]|uniref:NADPH-dependent FMN reductase n=1 Tax=Alsobacter soli TaxID=2109933 RepID=A0A2T1HX06_9HYPH|nr:NAD(P)H-dependent oxidoreductase [Alsobacter soli]PSC06130.1 NADPH-dependent FMN reductase [Alsobacter soli]